MQLNKQKNHSVLDSNNSGGNLNLVNLNKKIVFFLVLTHTITFARIEN